MPRSSTQFAAPSPDALVEFLLDPAAHPDCPARVELIETHISRVFLSKHFAYKLKKNVKFEFLDFSTVEKRRQACDDELRLNRRLAPHVYLSVVCIARDEQGRLSIGAEGEPVEWLVKMRRLRSEQTLEALILAGRLPADDVERVAATLTEFYRRAPPIAIEPAAYRRAIERHIRANYQSLGESADAALAAQIKRVHGAQLRCAKLSRAAFNKRVGDGRIIEAHGDLRPEHIYLDGGEEGRDSGNSVEIIDCLEFSAELRQLDVADELSFLAMECERLGAAEVGRQVLESYGRASGDWPEEMLLDFYKCYRACVRAKVAAIRTGQSEPAAAESSRQLLASYVALADAYAAKLVPPVLLVVRGLMGSGKTTLAAALSDELLAEHLQTDALRNELLKADARDKAYGAGRYQLAERLRVYEEMFRRAQDCLAGGLSAVLDGTFLTADLRCRALAVAKQAGAAPLIVECQCSESVAKERMARRLADGNSASEARPELYGDQQRAEEPNPPGLPCISIDTTLDSDKQVRAVLERLTSLTANRRA